MITRAFATFSIPTLLSRTESLARGALVPLLLVAVFLATDACAEDATTPPALTERLEFSAQGFGVPYPPTWSVAPDQFQNSRKLINVPRGDLTTLPTARVKVGFETRLGHGDAVRRLQDLGDGLGVESWAYFAIDGWPAFQITRLESRPQPGKGPQFSDPTVLRVTTAVAAGNLLVRVEGSLPSGAAQVLVAEVEAMGRHLEFATHGDPGALDGDLESLRNPRPDSAPRTLAPRSAPDVAESSAPLAAATGQNQRLFAGGFGEVEIGVSNDAQNVIIGRQGDWVASNDFGQTFPLSGTIGAFDGGDPSLAFGVNGSFYYAGIDGGCRPADMPGPFGYTCTGMARSTNNGVSFPLVTPAVVCPNPDPNGMVVVPGSCFPDQEHIAADRFNAAGGGGEQIYSTWRNFDATDQDAAIVCSQDSGANWTAPLDLGTGRFPRITVGQDGFVYLAYFDANGYQIDKYSSCANGLVQQAGFPQMVIARIPTACPFAGHDRCDQNPSSQTVAVDDMNANHVYYAYVQNTAGGNDDVFVRDSADGGMTWPAGRVMQVNSAVAGARIMPWMCTTCGQAFVAWYDRRNATMANNDLTDYFAGSVGLDGANNLVTGPEFQVSQVADPWCAVGWPCGTRSTTDSETCSVQPQQAGFCQASCTGPVGTDSLQRCDFSANNCPMGETCCTGDGAGNAGGCPKYGDYNGNACIRGRLFTAWASATSPAGVPAANPGRVGILFDSFFVKTADVAIQKSAVSEPVTPGGPLSYSVTVTNNGPDPAFDVEVIDTLPAGVTFVSDTDACVESPPGTLTCDLGDIAPMGSVTFTIQTMVNANVVAPKCEPFFLTNKAVVSAAANDPNLTNNETSIDTRVVFPLNHFLCYETDREPFARRPGVQLDDVFGPGVVDVRLLKRLCTPTDKNGEDPTAPLEPCHLTGYEIRAVRPAQYLTRVVVNQFGSEELEVGRSELLLVPTAKDRIAAPPPLVSPTVDHFKCHRVRRARLRMLGLTLVDQIDSRTADILHPFRLCSPADKNEGGIIDPDAHLLCYRVRTTPRRPSFPGPFFITNQFDDLAVHLTGSRELCVPSTVMLP